MAVENTFGASHGYIDMNVFFMEGELRKQAGLIYGMVVCVVLVLRVSARKEDDLQNGTLAQRLG